MDREKVIVKVSIQGIIVNVILVIFKALVGFATGSIAIILDAINNLSDALSQIITIAGTKLSQKKPDKNHPYGYGRIEYISSVIVAALVLMAGFTSLKESAVKVIHPENPEYTWVSLLIIAVAVVVKFLFGRYVKGMGEKVQSQALIASGTDAFMDSILSFSTLVAALISKFAGLSLEGILGVVLSIFILRAGLEILKETLGSLIGTRADSDLTKEIKKEIAAIEGVHGAYDLILHDYGPSRSIGSVHVEVDESMSVEQFDHISRQIIAMVEEKYDIILTVGAYAADYRDPKKVAMHTKVMKAAKQQKHVIAMHGFYVNFADKSMSFDIVVSHKAKSAEKVAEAVKEAVQELYPGYQAHIGIDYDFSD